jgi:nitrogen-specific signal transduction histidine kinase
LKEDTATSILTRRKLSVKQVRDFSVLACASNWKLFFMVKPMPRKGTVQPKAKLQAEVAHLRTLAHDLSNALEAILQASYLVSRGKLDADTKRWAQLIETSSQEAARINREIRKSLRALGEE